MDNKAQISVEYLIIVALLIMIATLVALLSTNIFGIKEGVKGRTTSFLKDLSGMIS